MPTPEEAAHLMLDLYTNGEPHAYPIDPVEIARSFGINVYKSRLSNTLSGMIGRRDHGAETDLVINSEHAPVRQRFTTAHELGHYFAVTQDAQRAQEPFLHRRDQLAACGTNHEEIFANKFAAELLMPTNEVRRLHRVGKSAPELARYFRVSLDAMSNRLSNLGLA